MNVAEIIGGTEPTFEEHMRQRRQAVVREVLWAVVEQDGTRTLNQYELAGKICCRHGLGLVDEHDFWFAANVFRTEYEQRLSEPQAEQENPVSDEIRLLVKQFTELELAEQALCRQMAGELRR